jgi:hypothetical protein
VERELAARPPTPQPLVDRVRAGAEVGGDLSDRLPFFDHPANHQESTMDGRARILMGVHPGLRLGLTVWQPPASLPVARMNNLYGNYS